MKLTIRIKGGEGSGHFGHAGRPGLVGGSQPGNYYPGTSPKRELPGNPFQNVDVDDYAEEYINKDLIDIFNSVHSPAEYDTTMGPLTYDDAGPELRGKVKDDIVSEIANESGLPYDTVNELIANWAKTSNGDDLRALYLQKDFAEELGLELSDWQKDVIMRLENKKNKLIGQSLTRTGFGDFYVSSEPSQEEIDIVLKRYMEESYRIDKLNYDEHGGLLPIKLSKQDTEFSLISRASSTYEAQRFFRVYPEADQRKFASAMYDITQRDLADAGLSEVTLFRGFDTGPDEPKIPWSPSAQTVVGYFGNALESWSISYDVAESFGNTVLAMRVPAENVIGTCRSGFGCLTEGEFVIYANERMSDPDARPPNLGQTAWVVSAPYQNPDAEDYKPIHDRGDVKYDPNWNPIIQ